MKTLLAFIILSCIYTNTANAQQYKLISYLNIRVDSMGNLPTNPYVINLKKGKKQLLVIGTQHTRDPSHPMFTVIENAFKDFKPQVLIHEGGEFRKTYTSRNQAIAASGELGLEKLLADKTGVKTVSGDEPDKQEFEELSAAFSKDEALVFFASERFIFPYKFGQFKGTLEEEYDRDFIMGYMEKLLIDLSSQQKQLSYYKAAYKRLFNEDFALEKINQHNFTPFGKGNHFNDVTRKSKELRDRYLLKQIEAQLKLRDKVLVIYGGWHILAIEPALSQIIQVK